MADPALKLAQRIARQRLASAPPSEWAVLKAELPTALLPLCRALIACREALADSRWLVENCAQPTVCDQGATYICATCELRRQHEAALAQADEVIGV